MLLYCVIIILSIVVSTLKETESCSAKPLEPLDSSTPSCGSLELSLPMDFSSFQGDIESQSTLAQIDGWGSMNSFYLMVELGGSIVVWGGEENPENELYVYRISENKWEKQLALGQVSPFKIGAAGVAYNGLIYIYGGKKVRGESTNEIFTIDCTGLFKQIDSQGITPTKRLDHRGWLYDGKLYFFGGKDDSGVVVNTIEAFDPKDKTWSGFQTTNAPKLSAFALALNGDQVYVHGGKNENKQQTNTMYRLDLPTKEWNLLEGDSSPSRFYHALTPISATKLLLSGGESEPTWIFDSRKERWTQIESQPNQEYERNEHAVAVKINDGLSVFTFAPLYVYNVQ